MLRNSRARGLTTMRKRVATVFAVAAVVAVAGVASAAGMGGGIPGGFTAVPTLGSVPGWSPGATFFINNPGRAPQHFRELNIAGRVPADPAKLPKESTIVTLRVNGRMIPMALDAEAFRGELRFDPSADYGRDLYRSVMTKPIEVIGDEGMRGQITDAAANSANSKPLLIDGYVFDRMSPYLVLRSVDLAQ